ncbi:MAG TPA: 1-acyl-sn-glycerol-3-phosphate acyltransferase [Verrucomicrobiae bacterium]|nr:1-acyl-sn-glycerol-3-phosphate acyltransferase [Verrucomicrobiae bacterium]
MGDHIIDIGARVPRTSQPWLQRGALALLALLGWRLEVRLPDEPRLVLLAAPHTSNWDGVFAVLAMLALRLKLGLFVKHTAFEGVLGPVLRKVGALPIDRTAPGGIVAQTIEAFRTREQLAIGIAPEGTRRRVERWKRGFYLIADGAKVPIVCAYVDYGRKVVGTGLVMMSTGDYARDLEAIQAFYRTITPKVAARFNARG